ncbi:hypothetical protein [Paraburkholderia rhizosphaerae]|nr:hypothetical protein [Paraburkholderia rhizosphaerae]
MAARQGHADRGGFGALFPRGAHASDADVSSRDRSGGALSDDATLETTSGPAFYRITKLDDGMRTT